MLRWTKVYPFLDLCRFVALETQVSPETLGVLADAVASTFVSRMLISSLQAASAEGQRADCEPCPGVNLYEVTVF